MVSATGRTMSSTTSLPLTGVQAYPGSLALMEVIGGAGHRDGGRVEFEERSVSAGSGWDRCAGSASSSTARSLERHGLKGKPSGETYTYAASLVGSRSDANGRRRGRAVGGRRWTRRQVRTGRRRRPRGWPRRADLARRRPRGERSGRAGDPVTGPHANRGAAHTPPPVHDPLDRNRFPADPWRLTETIYADADLGRTETLFAVGNGYLGLRGNVEEGRVTHAHGTFINGFHETWGIRHAEEAFGFAGPARRSSTCPMPRPSSCTSTMSPCCCRSPTSSATNARWISKTECCDVRSSGVLRRARGSGSPRSGWCRSASAISPS